MTRTIRLAGIAAVAALAAAACSSSDKETTRQPPSTTSAPRPTVPAAQRDRVVVRGTATLDGAPARSRFVGAVVLDHGLVTPCQVSLPAVRGGRYSVSVYAATGSAGCGEPGARIALWIFARNHILFSTNTVRWPGAGRTATLDATYSAAAPRGATPPVAQFQGGAFGPEGHTLPVGTRVEAYVGTTRCGVASLRSTPDYLAYILSVVGPESIPGCTRGAPIKFRLAGRPATPTNLVNTPPGRDATLDLRQQ